MVEFALSNNYQPATWQSSGLVSAALELGNFELLFWLQSRLENLPPLDYSHVLSAAAKRGRIDLITLALQNGAVLTANIADCALLNSQVETFHFLLRSGCPAYTPAIIDDLARKGLFEALKAALEVDTAPTPCSTTFFSACSSTEKITALAMVEYLISRKCPWSTNAYEAAATANNLALLQFLVSQKTPDSKDLNWSGAIIVSKESIIEK